SRTIPRRRRSRTGPARPSRRWRSPRAGCNGSWLTTPSSIFGGGWGPARPCEPPVGGEHPAPRAVDVLAQRGHGRRLVPALDRGEQVDVVLVGGPQVAVLGVGHRQHVGERRPVLLPDAGEPAMAAGVVEAGVEGE